MQFTDRYAAYAASRGMSAEQMQEHNRFFYPNASSMDFMFWVREKIAQYKKETGFVRFYSEKDHNNFDEWLKKFSKLNAETAHTLS